MGSAKEHHTFGELASHVVLGCGIDVVESQKSESATVFSLFLLDVVVRRRQSR